MIKFIYEDSVHTFTESSLQELLNNKTILQMPLSYWKHVLFALNGYLSNNDLINVLSHKIKLYDSSEEVNQFCINGKNYWFDKSTRQSLYKLCELVEKSVDLILNDDVITVPKDILKDFLDKLELYSYQCYQQTSFHLHQIKKLKNEKDCLEYDYTTGYPKKLVLSVR